MAINPLPQQYTMKGTAYPIVKLPVFVGESNKIKEVSYKYNRTLGDIHIYNVDRRTTKGVYIL